VAVLHDHLSLSKNHQLSPNNLKSKRGRAGDRGSSMPTRQPGLCMPIFGAGGQPTSLGHRGDFWPGSAFPLRHVLGIPFGCKPRRNSNPPSEPMRARQLFVHRKTKSGHFRSRLPPS